MELFTSLFTEKHIPLGVYLYEMTPNSHL